LTQMGCAASYVSAKWGYLDQYLTSWEIKFMTVLGLLV
jgi:hypothetical protein